MNMTISETNRRRKIQSDYNRKHHITPTSIKKNVHNVLASIYEADYVTVPAVAQPTVGYVSLLEIPGMIEKLKKEMQEAAHRLEFEHAAVIREKIRSLEQMEIALR
jgi:excinuclease ABC subunit B